jgi:CRP-like cAMP-binding protein
MRSASGSLEALAQVPIFEGMSKKDLRAVAARLSPVDVAAGREFTRQGGGGSDFFVVLDGSAIVSRDGKPLCRVEKGGFFGELALLVPHERTATVTAETDMSVGVLTRPEFLDLVHELPAIAITVMEQLAMLALDVSPLRHTELVEIDLTEQDDAARPS